MPTIHEQIFVNDKCSCLITTTAKFLQTAYNLHIDYIKKVVQTRNTEDNDKQLIGLFGIGVE